MAYTYGSVANCKVRNGQTRTEYEVRLGYEVQSQSVANNTSTVKLRLECRSISSSYTTKGSSGLTSKIDGTTVKNNAAVDMSSTNTWQNFGERTITVTHNADGTYSASKSGSFTCTAGSSNYSLSSGSASVTVKPATIPRASTPTLSSSSVTMGSSVTITTNRASSNFTHTLKYSFGNTSGTIATGVGASYTWTPPTSLASQITNKLNGTCTITCETYNGSTLLGTKTVTMTLSVPSASVPTLSASSVEMGKSVTITTNRKAANFTHILYFSFGTISWRTISTGVGASVSWTPTIDLASQIPNTTSGTCTIYCETYNNGIYVGTQAITLTLTVPASVVPTISSISVSEGSSTIPSSWGVYVQGKSKLQVTITASGASGSTISTYKTTGIDSNTYWASSFVSSLLQGTGTKTITAKVVDSRGREATKTASYNCVAYSNPSISVATVTRCNSDGTNNEEGEYVKYSFKASVASVSSKNTYSYKLGYKKSGDSSYTYITISNSSYSLNKENVVISGVTFSVDNSYDFEFYVSDYFTSTTVVRQLGTGFTLLDFNASGKGMAIGKVSEKDALEVNMDIYNKNGAILEAVKVSKEAPTNKEAVWIKKGKNLYNGRYLTNYNYNSSTGVLEKASSPMFCTTEKISIPVNAQKLVVSKYGSRIYVRYFFYNTNGGFLSTTASQVGVDVPSNAKYVTFHCTSDTVSGDFTTIQLETTDSSGKATAYEEYVERSINVKNENGEYEEIYGIKSNRINNNSYSTSEQVIGTWIDGKPLYRKVIEWGNMPNATTETKPHNIANVEIFITVRGMLTPANNGNGNNLPLPFVYESNPANSMRIFANHSTVLIGTSSDRSYAIAYVILEYTKTTD